MEGAWSNKTESQRIYAPSKKHRVAGTKAREKGDLQRTISLVLHDWPKMWCEFRLANGNNVAANQSRHSTRHSTCHLTATNSNIRTADLP